MTDTIRFEGVLSPVVTPFRGDLAPDESLFTQHCEWLLAGGCDGLAVFGTNSEANSLSVAEKRKLLDALAGAGLSGDTLMPGTGACAISDAVELTRAAMEHHCGGVLMLPPFYYKDVPDDGLYAYFSEVIQRVGDSRLRVYLYHIPPVSQVGISLALIERLLHAYPGTVAGVKDSSGDWTNTKAMLDAYAADGFDVFAGSEAFLLRTMQNGGKGCITATGNINPGPIAELYKTWRDPGAEGRQQALIDTRAIVARYPMIPALKAVVAHYAEDDRWRTTRPPLVSLDTARQAELITALQARGFDMPDLGTTGR